MSRKLKGKIVLAMPFLAIALSAALYYLIPESGRQKKMAAPYYLNFLYFVGAAILLSLIAGKTFKDFGEKLAYKLPFYTGAILFFAALNLVVSKFSFLQVLYFPSLDRIIGLIWTQKIFLAKNLFFSIFLLARGFMWGLATGFLTGLALGYNQKVGYWLNPITKVLGPVPTTAWTPLALSVFPTTQGANIFLIAFAVWFPVALMTASGIQSVDKKYFEVGQTLGAKTFCKILRIAVPASMPQIFLGLFYGTVSSFTTLMAVEMNGNSSGIGWYINWQKSVMQYDGVYAGLIIIALLCYFILTILFSVRNRIMSWQKGVIRW